VFLFVAPLQLVPRFRTRRAGIHRRLGYVLLAIAVPYAITGILLSVYQPGFGPLGGLASGLAGAWFVNCAVRAYLAIRRRDIDRHREWMLRMLAIAYGIAIVRLLFLAIVAIEPIDPMALGAATFWAGWLLAALPTEWWIHRTARRPQALRWAS
jgi:peptidoglycan biosynthesis protein MviN/MurJ (putative lipid II flippase)